MSSNNLIPESYFLSSIQQSSTVKNKKKNKIEIPYIGEFEVLGRSIQDPIQIKKAIKEEILNFVNNRFVNRPITLLNNYTLNIKNVEFGEEPSEDNETVTEAIELKKSLTVPLYAQLEIVDNSTGKTIYSGRKIVAHVPYMLNQGIFILNGTKYILVNQLRLRPGIYFRFKNNYNPSADVNSVDARELSHRYVFDPRHLKINVEFGQSTIPIYTWLKLLGATDEEIRYALGDEIYSKNYTSSSIEDVWAKLKNKIKNYTNQTDPYLATQEALSKLNLDKNVNKITIGEKTDRLDKYTVLNIVSKLIEMNKGTFKPYDKDDLAFKYVYGPEDLLAEAFHQLPQRVTYYLRKLPYSKHKDFSKILPAGFVTKDIMNFFYNSGLGMNPDEHNPMEIFDIISKVTIMGRGGIGSPEAVTAEARNIHPSYLNFIDPIRTPEKNVGTDLRFASTVVKRGKNIYALFKNIKTGKYEWLSPLQTIDKVIGFPESYYLPDEYVPAIKNRKLQLVKKDEIEYVVPSSYSIFNPSITMLPAFNASFAHRLAMGAKMTQQALPLVHREAPLVQNALKPGYGWADYLGRFAGAVFAEQDGEVVSVTDKEVVVKYKNGEEKKYHLWKMVPTNRETFYFQKAMVVPSQKVKKGDCLITSNFTDDKGSLALGVNLLTAYVPYLGYTFEDAVVVSESAAKNKLASQYLFPYFVKDSPDFIINKSKYISLFPTTFTKEQLNKLDDQGIVKEGQILYQGDPIVVAFDDPEKNVFWIYGKKFRLKPNDNSLIWDKSYPGKVVKVTKGDKEGSFIIHIFAEAPLQVGDKVVGLYGDKGVVSAIIPDDQMPKTEDGRTIELIENPFALFRRNPALLIAGWLGLVAEKTGKKYYIDYSPDKLVDLYQLAKEEAKKHNIKLTQNLYDPAFNKIINNVSVGNRYFYKLKFTSESKASYRSFGGYSMEDMPVKGGEFGCLHPDTEILYTNGYKCAKYITKDTKLLTFDFSSKSIKRALKFLPVSNVFEYEIPNDKIYLKIKTNLGQEVIVSKQHQFFTEKGEKKTADKLKINDKILSIRILPNNYQWIAILLLIGLSYIKETTTNRFILKLTNVQPSLRNYLNTILKPYIFISKEENYNQNKTKVNIWRILIHPYSFFEKIIRKIKDLRDNQNRWVFLKKSLKTYFGLTLFVALCGKMFKNGAITLKIPKYLENKNILDICSLIHHYWPSDPEPKIVTDEEDGRKYILFSKETSDRLIDHISRYFLPSWLSDSSLARVLSQFNSKLPFSRTVQINSLFNNYEEVPDKKSSELNRFYLLPATIVSITVYKPKEKYENTMYDFTIQKTHNYITADWIILSNSKRIGLLNTYGLLAHGATKVLRDMKLIKGQRNDIFWNNFIMNFPLPEPQIPLIYHKFINFLRGSGINVTDDLKEARLTPLTDSDIDELAKGRYITSEKIIQISKDSIVPSKNGLFDEELTGGFDGTFWSAIKLPFPIPNPIVEKFLRQLIGITEKQLEDILTGKGGIDGQGKFYEKENFYKVTSGKIYTGPQGLQEFFKNYSVKKAISELKDKLATESSPSKKTEIINKLIFLEALNSNDIHPYELFWTKVPVIPPIFRPVGSLSSATKERLTLVSDVNILYSDLIRAVQNYEGLKNDLSDLSDEIKTIYKSVKAIIGISEPVSRRAIQRNISGLLKHVFGKAPKYSMMQYSLLAMPVDIVGRSVIVPDPTLRLDEIGLPEKVLWEVYRPFILRRLIMKGIPKNLVLTEYEKRTPRAYEALKEEMEYRPVIVDRAPLLHKFGMLAFWPKITEGFVMKLNPLVCEGFGADFDGDTMNYHVPVTEEARLEAIEKMLPSKNVIQPRHMKAQPSPSKDFAAGIYLASTAEIKKNKVPKIYTSLKQLFEDLKTGKLDPDDPVIIDANVKS